MAAAQLNVGIGQLNDSHSVKAMVSLIDLIIYIPKIKNHQIFSLKFHELAFYQKLEKRHTVSFKPIRLKFYHRNVF